MLKELAKNIHTHSPQDERAWLMVSLKSKGKKDYLR